MDKKIHYPSGNIGIFLNNYRYLISNAGVLKELRAIDIDKVSNVTSIELHIPSEICGEKITHISENFIADNLKCAINKIVIDNGIIIDSEAFYDCENLTVVKWNDCKVIPYSCFSCCSSLRRIENTSSVEVIERLAFYSCNKLDFIDVPLAVKEIGESAFEGCYSLEDFRWPNNCDIIQNNVFANCHFLERIENIEHIKSIGVTAFVNTALKSFTIPSQCFEIKERAFFPCLRLKKITASTGEGLFIGINAFPLDREIKIDFSKRVFIASKSDLSKIYDNIKMPFYHS